MKISIQYDDGLAFAVHTIERGDADAWRALFEDAPSKRTGFVGTPGDARAREFAGDLVAAARAADMDLESRPERERARDSAEDRASGGSEIEDVQGGDGGISAVARRVVAVGSRSAMGVMSHLRQLSRGAYGLATTLWGFGLGLTAAVLLAAIVLVENGDTAGLAVAGSGVHAVYSVFVWIGVWNAAGRYRGQRIWSLLARGLVAFLVLAVLAVGGLVVIAAL